MRSLDEIYEAIIKDPENSFFSDRNIKPLYSANPAARICLIGQAPGIHAQMSGIYWNDASGERLRAWTGISSETFYNSPVISVLPMDFYYPGKGNSGDLPPRKNFAQKWHPELLAHMPQLELIVLIGSYAQKEYLPDQASHTATENIHNYKAFLPRYFPIVHPSPRNNIWLKRNPWFVAEVVPELKRRIQEILMDR